MSQSAPFGVLFLLAGCGSKSDGFECGPGTVPVDGQCVPEDDSTGSDDGTAGDDSGAASTDNGSDSGSDSGGTDSGDTDTDGGTDSGDTDGGTDSGTGTAWDVCSDGVAPYTDIQDAIDAASDGDTILVCAGTYSEFAIEGTSLTLRGDGSESTFVDGGSRTAVVVVGSTVTMSGFSLSGTSNSDQQAAGLWVESSSLTAHDLRINGCSEGLDAVGAYGLLQSDSTTELQDVVIEDNELGTLVASVGEGGLTARHVVFRNNRPLPDGWGGAVLDLMSAHYRLSNIVVHNNEAGSENLIELHDTDDGWLYNSVVHGNRGGKWAVVAAADRVVVENVIVAENDDMDGVTTSDGGSVQYTLAWGNDTDFGAAAATEATNLSANPRFTDSASGDFTLQAGLSPAEDAGNPLSGYNDPDGTRNDMGAYGGPFGEW